MLVERVELANYCQFRSLAIDLPAGLIAVVGPNGSGKSNFVEAIRLAVTGDNTNVGTKALNISQFAAAGERSYVRVCFSHGSTRATVTRNLYPARPTAVLQEEGRPDVVGDEAVTSRIEAILGTTMDVVHDTIIVAQDDIFGFLEKTPAKRAELFQKLFCLQDAMPTHKLLLDSAAAAAGGIPVPDATMDQLRARLLAAETAGLVATQQLAGCPTVAAITAEATAAAVVTNKAIGYRQALTEARLAAERLAAAGPARDAAVAAAAVAVSRWQELAQRETAERAEAAAAKAGLQAAALYRNYTAMAVQLDEQLRRTEHEAQQLTSPVPPPDYRPASTVMADITQMQREVYPKRELYAQLTKAAKQVVVTCPTCGTPEADLATKIAALVAELAPLDASLQQLAVTFTACDVYDKAQQRYVEGSQRHGQRLAELRQQREALGVVPPPVVDEAAAGKIVAAHQQCVAELTAATTIRDATSKRLAELDGMTAQLQQEHDRRQREVATIPTTFEADAAAAAQTAESCQRLMQQRRDLETTRTLALGEVTTVQQSLAVFETARENGQIDIAWKAHVETMAELVHRDAAPRFASQQALARLQQYVNANLEMLQAEYRVQADDGLSFIAYFNDGVRQQPAERLSGGQKVVLALAFRLATNLQLAAGLGALYLDEPTAYLDKTHIRGFEPALTKLREFSQSHGLQCVIVTHEAELAPLFDMTVQLESQR